MLSGTIEIGPAGLATTAGPSVSTLSEKGTSALGQTTATSVYRYYDRHGVLIYVGITDRGIRRNREHNDLAVWWPFVVRQEVDHLDTRDEALAHEKALIVRFRPPFNTQHNPDAESLRAAYVAFASSGDADPDPMTLWRELRGVLPLMMVEQSSDFLQLSLTTRPTHFPIARKIAPLDPAALPPVLFQANRVGLVASVEMRSESLAVFTIRFRGSRVDQVGRVRRTDARLIYLSKARQFGVKHVEVFGYDTPRRDPHYMRRKAGEANA